MTRNYSSSLWKWFRRTTNSARPGTPGPRRLRLEALEDRTLLSPGDLDPTFGTGGSVTTVFPSSNFDVANGVALQADGRIVAAGLYYRSSGGTEQFGLARYNRDGSLDPSFGASGLVTTSFGGAQDSANCVTVQPDGRIVAAGFTGEGLHSRFALARYNRDGSLDTSFGGSGRVTTAFGSNNDGVTSLAVQGDGRLIAAGYTSTGTNTQFALARYNRDGSLDTSFGNAGRVITSFGGQTDAAFSVALQDDGRIIAAGRNDGRYALARYNTDGTLDSSFGGAGQVTTSFLGGARGESARGVVVQSDGRILAAGLASLDFTGQFALVRYNSDGSLDTSFGTGGKVVTGFGGADDEARSVVVQSNGRIVAAGYTQTADGSSSQFALARYNSDGSLDTSFGVGGLVTTSIGNRGGAIRLALQPDGHLVAAGYTMSLPSAPEEFALARYEGDSIPSQTLLDSSLSPSVYGQSITFTATITVGGHPVAAGTVTFTDGSTALTTVNVDGSGRAAYTTTDLSAATSPHQITAAYDGGGGGGFGSGMFQQVVSPAPLTITADDQTKVAGDQLPTLTATYSGFVNGDDPSSLSTPVSLSTYPGDTAGSYPIVPSGATAANYAITFVNGTLTVSPAAAASLLLDAPATVTAGQPFDVTVSARDPYGNVDPGYTGTVSLTSSDPAAANLGIYTFTAADAGVYTFTDLQLFTGSPQSVFASDGSLAGQADLVVSPGAAAFLVLSGPSSATAGVPFSITVTAYDTWGNVATGYTGTVMFSSDDPAAGLPSDYAFQPEDQGSRSFQVTLQTPGTHQVTVNDTLDPSISGYLDVTL